ncbi:MAG: TetR/AcrR family transcriptional regulator [Comamonadaceae bacterium]|nr:MAG: TetR/AcrR family transcriptional regulator [Comamonadaceae bacterium]
MPRIEAATVAEQRAKRYDELITAAEEILAQNGLDALTAGAVAKRVGIARNSLYRYFASIDDLVELVVTREFPSWAHAVRTAVDEETTPSDRIAAYVRSNVQQAASSTHGWRSALSKTSLSEQARKRVRDMHIELNDIARRVLVDLHPEQIDLQLAIVQALVDACIRRIDLGDDPDEVLSYAVAATRRLITPTD